MNYLTNLLKKTLGLKDDDMERKLQDAAFKGNKNTVEALLNGGADPNKEVDEGWTPLLCAVFEGHQDVVQMLLDKGAVPNKQDKYGTTPLLLASQHDNICMALAIRRVFQNQEEWSAHWRT